MFGVDPRALVCFLESQEGCSQTRGQAVGVPQSAANVRWIGVPGMLWSKVLPEVHHYARLDQPPGVLLLHVGGQ